MNTCLSHDLIVPEGEEALPAGTGARPTGKPHREVSLVPLGTRWEVGPLHHLTAPVVDQREEQGVHAIRVSGLDGTDVGDAAVTAGELHHHTPYFLRLASCSFALRPPWKVAVESCR